MEWVSAACVRCCKFALQFREKPCAMLQLHVDTFNPFSENTYIIYNEHKACWIVDPGMYEEREMRAFTTFIAKEGLKPQAIINTHAHLDHIFGVEAMMK